MGAAGPPHRGLGPALRLVTFGYRHAAPIPFDATTSDRDPSGVQLLLIACAAMADVALPA